MEKNASTISVIIPTYCRGEQIRVSAAKMRECLGVEDELILVDQTETPSEETRAFYESLLQDSRVSIYYSAEKSSGQARNTGAFFSRGEILLFWDDDLEPVGNVVEQHRKWYQESDVCGVAGCYWGNYIFQPKGTANAWNFAAGHISLRRELFFQVGGFNTNLIYPFIPEDYELHVRLEEIGGGRIVPDRECGGNHADVHGISYGSRQTASWFAGVLHNHFYLCWRVLWARSFSPSAFLVVLHVLFSLFRYMFPLKLLRQKEMRRLLWKECGESWKTFRGDVPGKVEPPKAETVLWRTKFSMWRKNTGEAR